MLRHTTSLGLLVLLLAGCEAPGASGDPWKLDEASRGLVGDPNLERRIFRALDAAAETGTYPPISKYQVRTATVVDHEGEEHVVVGGNTEYHVPEAIHGESALLNHVTSLFGPDVTREKVRFIAYYSESCGESLSCGDCRDYQVEVTDAENLLAVCGDASTGRVQVRAFRDALVPEESFPEVPASEVALSKETLERLVGEATEARKGGIDLFTTDSRHSGAAALSRSGAVYRAAGVDDAAFHYRYPIGGLLQQAATERDYFLEAVVVVGEPGSWPRVSYRDRQYGYEFSSFNAKRGYPPIQLVLADGTGRYRLTTFEEALPYAFSTSDFMPGRVDEFLAPR